eukprot:gene9744-20266_t
MSYQRLDENLVIQPDGEQFSIRILCKEKSHAIDSLSVQSTVKDLKNNILGQLEIPLECQRLIFNGKILQPEDKSLESFGIQNNAAIHLFPKQVINKPVPIAEAVPSTDIINPIHNVHSESFTTTGATHQPVQFDPFIVRTRNEVKLWCYLLLMTSSFRLFGALTTIAATGAPGVNLLDNIVQTAELICSTIGLYVAHLGIKSTMTMDIATIKRYVMLLCVLAALAIIVRLTWVADVVMLAEQARRDHARNSSGDKTDPNANGGSGTSDPNNTGHMNPNIIDEQSVILFGLQAAIIAALAASIWMSCVVRAVRFQSAVQSYHTVAEASAPQAQAAAV